MENKNSPAVKIAVCGLLTSLMLILGYVESLLPSLPGVAGAKLGLANSVLLYGLYVLHPGVTFVLMGLKVLLSGLLFGGVSAMAYSLAGGLLSLLFMLLAKRIRGVSMIGVSITGAVFHNVGQVVMAMVILQTTKLIYYLSFLMGIGIVTGLLTGTAAMLVMKHLGIAVQMAGNKKTAKKAVLHEIQDQ